MRIAILFATAALASCGQQSTTTRTAESNTAMTEGVATTTANGNTTTAVERSTTSTTTTTAGDAAIPTAASLGLKPGKWETKISILSVEIDGKRQPAPPSGQAVMTCMTPEMAAKGPGEMIKKAGVNCTSTKATYSNGKISAQMTCKLPMGTMSSTTTGTYSPTEMTTDAEATVSGRMMIKQRIHSEARRIGDCG